MAENKKQISEYFSGLPENSSPSSATYLVVEENGVTKKIPISILVQKNADGTVTLGDDITTEGRLIVKSGSIFEDSIDVKYGNIIRFWSDDHTKFVDICCDNDGNLLTDNITSGAVNINTTSNTDMTAPSANILHTGPATGTDTAELMVLSGFKNAPYGFRFKTHGSGTAIIQSQRINSTSEMFPLSLNPAGGDVLVNGKKAASQEYVDEKVAGAIGEELQVEKIIVGDGIEVNGTIVVKEGYSVKFYRDENDDYEALWCNGARKLQTREGNLATEKYVDNKIASIPSGGSGDSSIIDLGVQENHKDAQQVMVDHLADAEEGCYLFKYWCSCYGNACFAVVRKTEGGVSGTVYDSTYSYRQFVYDIALGEYVIDGCWLEIASFADVFDHLPTDNKSVLGAIEETHAIATNGYKPSYFYFSSLDDENTWIVDRDRDTTRTEALIPSTWCGSPVVAIANEAFSGCRDLRKVIIPNSITSIGFASFGNCSSLTRIFIPSSVTSISDGAFIGCSNLTIYCEAPSKPDGWDASWNSSNRPVVWGVVTDFIEVNKKLAEIGDSGSSGGATLSMPRIKLASWYYDEIPVYDDMDTSDFTSGRIVFSINVQDGTVQEGDQLQVCALRSVFNKKKLRPILSRFITSEDVENLAKQPYLQISTDDLSGNNLGGGMNRVLTSFFRTDSKDMSTLKPKFIRIRRPIYKDGDDVDARFSNVEPVYIHLRYINLSEQLEEQISEQLSESD